MHENILHNNIGHEETCLVQVILALKYEDYPSLYVWNAAECEWRPRQRRSRINSSNIGRMVSIHPNQGEKFFLCMLLKHKAGATSYAHLQTVNNMLQPSFKAACMEMGLLASDRMWVNTLQDAIETQAHCQSIHYLFCNIIVHCAVSDPRALFEMFAEDMSNNFRRCYSHRMNSSGHQLETVITNNLLSAINNILQGQGHCNCEFDIEMPTDIRIMCAEDIDLDAEQFFQSYVVLLNEEQMHIFTLLMQCIDYNHGGCFNLGAPGGSGKTFL